MKNQIIYMLTFMIILLPLFLLSGCDQTELPPTTTTTLLEGTFAASFNPDLSLNQKQFSDVNELKSFLRTYSGSTNYFGGDIRPMAANMAMDTMTESAPMISKSAAGSNDFSTTNNQVSDVDEADIIKTDGKYIYTISGNILYIIDAYPGEDAKIITTIEFNNQPLGLFIDGNKLAIFGNFYDVNYFNKMNIQPRSGLTYFNVYDLSDIENPTLIKELKFEGRYFQARLTGDYVYFVTQTSPDYRHPIPMIIDGAEVKHVAIDSIRYYPIPYDNPHFVTVHSINMKNPEKSIDAKTITVEHGTNMYMSKDNIFLTYTKRINEWEIQQEIIKELMLPMLTDFDKSLIKKIEETDIEILSPYEKESKIMQIIQSYSQFLSEEEQKDLNDKSEIMLKERLKQYEYMEYTIINRISIKNGNINIKANGKVPGSILNQFSMDEYNSIFRIATTVSPTWSRINDRTESSNHIFTLNQDLKILDKLGDLAEGERIYSTRFMGEKLYLVTFRQVDPFFVIDLSNPNNIKELGQLKIPGFSRYLHPYDKNTIIGIGRDATETGRTNGLKISLFDVSDVNNPKEIAKYITEERYAQSTAEYEHKAFLFSKEKNLLVIPAYSSTWTKDGREDHYNGAMVFYINKDDIDLRGIIDHSEGQSNYYGALVERSLYIENELYTKSQGLLRINDLDTLKGINKIKLTGSKTNIPIY